MFFFLQEDQLVVVPYPAALLKDPELLERLCLRTSLRQYGRHLTIQRFSGHQVTPTLT